MTDTDRPHVWLVRHGETAWSASGRHTGRTDVPLTDEGRRQASAMRSRLAGLDVDLVLASPLSRAMDTERLAGFGDRVRPVDDLREWDYGAFEGLTTTEIRARHPGWTIWDGPVPEGETAADVAARADRVIASCVSASGDVLLFGHGHLLRVLAARWIDQPPVEGRFLALDTASLSELGWEHGYRVIELWNERGGLE